MNGAPLSRPVDCEGQLSVWGTINSTDSVNAQVAGRYIPGISLNQKLGPGSSADFYLSLNAFADSRFNYNNGSREATETTDLTLHRIYARLAWPRIELRIGLQRINFGSAVLMRPLMWFDVLDPRDPQQYSRGVYAALGRWYFYNNANLWLWGLYGNDETKGWEIFPSIKEKAEFGGRVQYPFYPGEIAFSYHYREMNLSRSPLPGVPMSTGKGRERKYAFDMRWDIEIGLWTEIVIAEQDSDRFSFRWQRFINLGADYTLAIGNGLGLIGEYLEIGEPETPLGSTHPQQFYALSISYSLGIADEIKGIFYHDVSRGDFYRYISLSHTLDNWRFILNGFWNPAENALIYNSEGMLVGRGLQLTLTFNH